MSHYDDAPGETEDRFHAQFDSREVKLMTLDELAAAFEAGEIHENTFVCREGDSEWQTLAVVAGLGEEQEEEPAPQPVVETRPPMPNRAPQAVAETRPPMPNRAPDVGASRPPMPNRGPDVGASRPPMPNRGPDLGDRRPPMPNRQPETNAVPASRQVLAYPPVVTAQSNPLSYAPVTSNINADLDLDELSLRPKRSAGRVLGVVALLALVGGGGAFAATGGLHRLPFATPSLSALENTSSKSQASLPVSNVEATPSTPAPVAAPLTPAPEPVAAVTPPAPSSTGDAPAATPGFSDDMKQALLTADNDRKAKHTQKAKGRATPSSVAHRSGGHSGGSATGFKSGGSAYDPLNGKL
jgi:GYF domain 2